MKVFLPYNPWDTGTRREAKSDIDTLVEMVAAMETSREVRARFPKIPIVWGGYFPSIYTQATLNAPYVDYAVRGQGEDTFLELLEALRTKSSMDSIPGLSYPVGRGLIHHGPERPLKAPDAFPRLPLRSSRRRRRPVEPWRRTSSSRNTSW